MKRYKLTIAYDGTAYNGWQRQPERVGVVTVQGEVERAAGMIVSHPVMVQGSSRTDAGVHAMGQVAAMNVATEIETEKLRRAINSRLPGDILIREMEEVGMDFDVRSSKRKRYRYVIWADEDRAVFNRQYMYHFYKGLDVGAMQRACERFVGEHDFTSFKGATDVRENSVRTIFSCGIHQRGKLVIFGVEGSGFLYHMVRTMVGTVLEVGSGKRQADCIGEIIARRDRKLAGACAPAQGLCLMWIRF